MAISSRAGWALGLGVLGVAAWVGVSHGQGDGSVQKTSGNGTATTTAKAVPAVLGSIDLETVFRGYEKTKFHMEQLKADAMAKEGQLKGYIAQAKDVAKEMEALQPGSKDFKDRDAKLTQLKANLQAVKESAQREFGMKEGEIMATFYKEVQVMCSRVARAKGMTYIVRVQNEAINSQDPESAMSAMSRPVVWSDPTSDITTTVVWNLNQEYLKAGGPVVKNPAGAAAVDEDTKPAAATGATRQAAPRTAAPAPRTAAPAGGRSAAPAGEK